MKKYFVLLFLNMYSLCYAQINSTKGNCEIIRIDGIKSSPNSNDLVVYYYSLGNSNWTLFNRTQDEYSQGLIFTVEKDIKLFLHSDEDASAYVGPLYIKGELLTNVGSFPNPFQLVDDCEKQIMLTPPNKPIPCNYNRISTPIEIYDIIPCSPLLEHDPPLVTNPSCNNTGTGSIPLKFKSDIKDDEQLLLNLFIKTTDTDPQFLYSKFVPKSSIINKEYTWTNISAGNYIIRYQAQKTTDNTTNVNSSAETTKAFSIVDPTKLKFKVSANNPLCNNGSTTLTIVANGGSPPYFYDDIEGTTEFINGETKIKRIRFNPSDEKSNEVSIPLLNPKSVYTIKVTDANYCTEK